jgi:hypothetical protein
VIGKAVRANFRRVRLGGGLRRRIEPIPSQSSKRRNVVASEVGQTTFSSAFDRMCALAFLGTMLSAGFKDVRNGDKGPRGRDQEAGCSTTKHGHDRGAGW